MFLLVLKFRPPHWAIWHAMVKASWPLEFVLVVATVPLHRKRKKPTWQNTLRHSTTSAYPSTSLPAMLVCSSSSRPTTSLQPIIFNLRPGAAKARGIFSRSVSASKSDRFFSIMALDSSPPEKREGLRHGKFNGMVRYDIACRVAFRVLPAAAAGRFLPPIENSGP